MKEKHITIRADEDLLRRLDEWRKAQELIPTRANTVRVAVERFLKQEAAK